MKRKFAIVLMLAIVSFLCILPTVAAASITSVDVDKDVYLAGQTGTISLAVYNENNQQIRITELSAAIDYYYADGTVYRQTFYTNVELPTEIEAGQTEEYEILISLPTNIASGYINVRIEARTELWIESVGRWISSDRPTDELKLFVESPYKQMYEDSQDELQGSLKQLDDTEALLHEQKQANQNLTSIAIALVVATFAFAGVAAFLMFSPTRRPQPAP